MKLEAWTKIRLKVMTLMIRHYNTMTKSLKLPFWCSTENAEPSEPHWGLDKALNPKGGCWNTLSLCM